MVTAAIDYIINVRNYYTNRAELMYPIKDDFQKKKLKKRERALRSAIKKLSDKKSGIYIRLDKSHNWYTKINIKAPTPQDAGKFVHEFCKILEPSYVAVSYSRNQQEINNVLMKIGGYKIDFHGRLVDQERVEPFDIRLWTKLHMLFEKTSQYCINICSERRNPQ